MPTTGTNLTGRAGLLGAWGYLANTDSWLKGALDVAKTGTILVFSAGNGGYANPSPRAAATYFMPELEKNWIGVARSSERDDGGSPVGQRSTPRLGQRAGAHLHQCGVAKWGA